MTATLTRPTSSAPATITEARTGFLDLVRDRVVVYDGSMGATILNMQLDAPRTTAARRAATSTSSSSNPASSRSIHAAFLEVGVDVLETDTFGGSQIKLEEYGLGERTYELNRTAAALARRVADEYTHRQPARASWPARSARPACCPPPKTRCSASTASSEVVELFLDQIRGLVDGGSDLLIIETVQDILELKAAVHAALRSVRERAASASRSRPRSRSTPRGRMLLGTDIAAALAILEHLPVDIIGLNCSTGPEHMREPARYLGEHSHQAGRDHPQRRHPDQRQRPRRLPAGTGTDGARSARDGRASSASASSAAAAARPRSTSPARSTRSSAARHQSSPGRRSRCRRSRR